MSVERLREAVHETLFGQNVNRSQIPAALLATATDNCRNVLLCLAVGAILEMAESQSSTAPPTSETTSESICEPTGKRIRESDEPEVTEAMLEAGFHVFAASGISDDPLEADKLTLADVYCSMWKARPTPSG